ncbi:alpha/beta fold hydrolase [Vagococcus acidifermentans]|uniref:Alpha/beta hydrolase n=1 Tax=Vagococcus acidifermentans TaxID=564710 RepID=A0A430ANY0_9ENTE|nr:alpha/beta hydrolase [Vagococcus acidifermentans]RSU09809.1 alpha/beta hydrolase [Vagococcus acidifermentans]
MSFFNYQSYKIFYEEIGKGEPLVLLHGNTASSKMFEMILPLYQENFKVILIDFLGNGKSDRVEKFPPDLWFWQAQQIIVFLEQQNYGPVNLVGTSGGAYVAINTALERPDLVRKVVADSFDGRTLADDFAENLLREREFAKKDAMASQFYKWCQGDDWETVVDMDTQALVECAEKKLDLFPKSLESLEKPILILGSLEDEMCRNNIRQEYEEMNQLVSNGKIHLFQTGGHPAILTRAEESAKVITDFLEN